MRLTLKWEEVVPQIEWRARIGFFEIAVRLENEAFECWAFGLSLDKRFNEPVRAKEYVERHAERLLRQALAMFRTPSVDVAVRANRLWKELQAYSPPQAVEALAEALLTTHDPVDVEKLIWASRTFVNSEDETGKLAVRIALARFGE